MSKTITWVLVASIVFTLVFGIVMTGVTLRELADGRNDEAYIAWCKLTGRTDISKKELFSLKRRGLLNVHYTAGKPIESK